jgi:uncharacterized protein (TIGR01615 family)
MTAVFRPSPLQACPPAAAAARPTTDVAELGPEKEDASNLYNDGRLQQSERVDSRYSSSGSEHEPSSVCLAAMVHEFMEHEGENGKCGRSRCNCEAGTCSGAGNHSSDSEDGKSSLGGELSEILQVNPAEALSSLRPPLLRQISYTDRVFFCFSFLLHPLIFSSFLRCIYRVASFQGLSASINVTERILLSEVTKALNAATEKNRVKEDEAAPDSSTRRAVMNHLRAAGYNAAICKSRWDHAGGFPGGDYEYIDVVFETKTGKKSERILIDTDFRTQFEIARPTKQYNAVVQGLAAIFVGREDRLQQIVNLMSDAVKASLKKRGMPLPPWRKPEYMRAKWFSSYKRTTNIQSVHSNCLSGRGNNEPLTRDISRIAVRGSGWDSKYTDEMEIEYQKAEVRQVMKEMRKEVRDAAFPMSPETVFQGGSNRPHSERSSDSGVSSSVDIVVVENMDWELPAVKPRTMSRRPAALTGLAAILKEAGLTVTNTEPTTEQIMHRRSLAMAI